MPYIHLIWFHDFCMAPFVVCFLNVNPYFLVQVKLNRQRRASTSFDYQIEGELVTAEEKKEVRLQ
ncbi:MAG: hypothetical protein GY748_15015 [Planctomycetaceae bacterium]|nr:hypothetical protein [Planctomycetaceae bacterium]